MPKFKLNPVQGELDYIQDYDGIEGLGFVPYTGATADVDLGTHDITSTNILYTGVKYNYNPDLPDIGAEQKSPLDGYGISYLSNKILSNCVAGTTAQNTTGAFRTSSGTYQIYQDGVWNDVVVGFRLREDSNEDYEFEHKPIGFLNWYEIASGNGNDYSISGFPFIQQYSASMGAYSFKLHIDGGTF